MLGIGTIGKRGLGESNIAQIAVNNVATSSPAVGTPTFTLIHTFTATPIANTSPSVGLPGIGQRHALTANGVVITSPTFGTITFGQTHALSANNVATASPSTTAKTFTSTHVLTANNVASSSPAITQGTFGQRHTLGATNILVASPTIVAPSVGQSHVLSATNASTSVAAIQSTAIGQTHLLSAANLATAPPSVGVPVISQRYVLAANNISVSSPFILPATFAQPDRIALRPISDIARDGWTNHAGTSELYSALNEVDPSDADFIQSLTSPHINIARLKLASPAPLFIEGPIIVSYRYEKDETVQPGTAHLTVRLMEGSTTIASWTHNNISDAVQGASHTLTNPQIASIVDQSDLYVEFEANT